jgi:hypothetical protein
MTGPVPTPVPAPRCPRCGSRLGAAASRALARMRRAEAEGRTLAVSDEAPFCGCCGLLFPTED